MTCRVGGQRYLSAPFKGGEFYNDRKSFLKGARGKLFAKKVFPAKKGPAKIR
jgi:hypothetical protein